MYPSALFGSLSVSHSVSEQAYGSVLAKMAALGALNNETRFNESSHTRRRTSESAENHLKNGSIFFPFKVTVRQTESRSSVFCKIRLPDLAIT